MDILGFLAVLVIVATIVAAIVVGRRIAGGHSPRAVRKFPTIMAWVVAVNVVIFGLLYPSIIYLLFPESRADSRYGLPDLSWMAWTWHTAIFFLVIFSLIALMGLWEYVSPGGEPRVGVLRFETTRGDRLFLSLLSAAFIHLGWLYFTDLTLWYALGVSVLFALLIYRFV